MKKSIEYNGDEEEEEIVTIHMGAVEFSELIEQRINVPGRKSKKTIKEINSLIDEFNSKFGKLYARIS